MPSANILIRNVTAVLTADDDAAGVAMGSEMSGGIFNVTIEDCVFGTEQFASGVYIKSTNRHTSLARHGQSSIRPRLVCAGSPTRGGYVHDIVSRRIQLGNLSTLNTSARGDAMEGVSIFVSTAYGDANPSCPQPAPIVQPAISRLSYSQISQIPGTAVRTAAQLVGDAEAWVENVTMKDVDLPANWEGFECKFVRGGRSTDTVPRPQPAAADHCLWSAGGAAGL